MVFTGLYLIRLKRISDGTWQALDIGQMFVQSWATAYDADPTINTHWVTVSLSAGPISGGCDTSTCSLRESGHILQADCPKGYTHSQCSVSDHTLKLDISNCVRGHGKVILRSHTARSNQLKAVRNNLFLLLLLTLCPLEMYMMP